MIVWDMNMILCHIPYEYHTAVEEAVGRRVADAVAEERAACAKLADEDDVGERIAYAIRQRGRS